MATTAKLTTKLTVQSAAFDRKMKGASTRVKTLGRSAAKSRTSLKSLGAAMKGPALAGAAALTAGIVIATLAFRKFVSTMSETFDAIDRVAKVSTRLNLTVQELQAFGLGAQLAGSSTEVLTKGLTKLARAVGDIKLGIAEKTILDVFEAIGLSARDVEQLTTSQTLRRVADGISNLSDQSKRAAVAMGIFGRSGVELLPFLQQGAMGLRDMEREARNLGFVFDKLDAAGIERANDSVSRLKFQWKGFNNLIAVTLAQPVEAFFTGISSEISNLPIEVLRSRIVTSVNAITESIADFFAAIDRNLATIQGFSSLASLVFKTSRGQAVGDPGSIIGPLASIADADNRLRTGGRIASVLRRISARVAVPIAVGDDRQGLTMTVGGGAPEFGRNTFDIEPEILTEIEQGNKDFRDEQNRRRTAHEEGIQIFQKIERHLADGGTKTVFVLP